MDRKTIKLKHDPFYYSTSIWSQFFLCTHMKILLIHFVEKVYPSLKLFLSIAK